MANLSEVLDHGLAGGKIRKACWTEKEFISFVGGRWVDGFEELRDFYQHWWLADDWEIYYEPATDEEIAAYFECMAAGHRIQASTDKSAIYTNCAEIVRSRKIPEGM